MVNTFILFSPKKDPEYKKSAQYLDLPRLRKQILEASQIINIIQDFMVMSKRFNIKIPAQMAEVANETPDFDLFLSYREWLTEVAKKYKTSKEKLYWKICKCPQKGTETITETWSTKTHQVIWTTKKYTIVGDKVIINPSKNPEKYPREECCVYEKGERAGSLGFYNHPVTRMWVGYLNALKLYHNTCLEEYISRGYKPKNMKLYEIKGKVIHPFWTFYPGTKWSYRASLLRKEYGNNEPAWYTSFPEIVKVLDTPYFSRGYIWWSNLKKRDLEYIQEKGITEKKHHSPLQLLESPKEARAKKRGDIIIVLKV